MERASVLPQLPPRRVLNLTWAFLSVLPCDSESTPWHLVMSRATRGCEWWPRRGGLPAAQRRSRRVRAAPFLQSRRSARADRGVPAAVAASVLVQSDGPARAS